MLNSNQEERIVSPSTENSESITPVKEKKHLKFNFKKEKISEFWEEETLQLQLNNETFE